MSNAPHDSPADTTTRSKTEQNNQQSQPKSADDSELAPGALDNVTGGLLPAVGPEK